MRGAWKSFFRDRSWRVYWAFVRFDILRMPQNGLQYVCENVRTISMSYKRFLHERLINVLWIVSKSCIWKVLISSFLQSYTFIIIVIYVITINGLYDIVPSYVLRCLRVNCTHVHIYRTRLMSNVKVKMDFVTAILNPQRCIATKTREFPHESTSCLHLERPLDS